LHCPMFPLICSIAQPQQQQQRSHSSFTNRSQPANQNSPSKSLFVLLQHVFYIQW
jgi:hypothetical protein